MVSRPQTAKTAAHPADAMARGASLQDNGDTRRQSNILDASERLVAAHSLQAVVDVLRDTARAAVGAEGIAIALKEGDRCSYVAEDAVAPLWQGQSFPADECVSGWAMRERRTVAIGDVRLDARVPQQAYAATFVRSLIMVPIGRPEPVAALGAYWSEPVEHDRNTIERLESLGRLATIAIENARLAQARDRAEAELRASEARYRQIVEGAEDFGIVTLDVTGVITGWNSGAEHLIGYPEAEAIGRSGGLFFTPEDQAEHLPEQEMARASSDGRAVNERWHVRKDGTRFWGSGLTMPLADGAGGYVKIFRDRTSEHNADAAIRASEARLRFFSALEERLFAAADAEGAMQAATRLLGEKLDASRCAYADVEADNDRFWIRSDHSAPGIASSIGSYSLDLFGPRAASDMRTGQALIVRDVSAELGSGEGREMFEAIGIAAIICCPLVKDGRLAAMMAIHQDRARDWTADEISLVKEVAERCWAHVERVGAEARLRESEERLRLAVENAEVGFWDVDVIHDILTWPPRTKAMFGISADVPVTMDDFYNGLHPDDRDATAAAYHAAADPNQRALYDVEYRTIGREDGVERWVAAKGRGVFDETGRCLRIAGTALDVTERKAAEVRRAALIELTNAIRDLQDPVDIGYSAAAILGRTLGSTRVGYGAVDHDTDTLYVDRDWVAPGVETLAGATPLRDYGSFIDSLKLGEFTVIEDTRLDPRTAGPAADALQSKSTRSFVNAPVLEHGRLVSVFFVNHPEPRNWNEGDLSLIRDFADRIRTAVERARGEEALRVSEARLREMNETLEALVEARSAERDRLWNLSQDMLARADYSGMMSAISPAWTQVLGWSERELLSRGYETFMHPDDAPATLLAIAEMSDTRRPTRFENRISTKDGGWRYIEWTVAPEPDGINFIAVGRDLSFAKAREAELEQAREALRQSQKMEAMGSLTGGVAHDFNNLLTPIIGSLDMLVRKGIGSERERRLIDGALQSAERAKTLVQRLLAFARRQPLQPTAVDISRLVESMAALLTSTLGPTIDIRLDLAAGLPPANADANQLEMALLNLAVNARDAMPDGGELTITARRDSVRTAHPAGLKPGHYVRLCVGDTGSGMDEATLKRAAEPFFSTKGIGKGTGLGLSMVHGLAAQLGGGLAIESTLGSGTVIELWLPISTTAIEGEDQERSTAIVPNGRGVALLVDDEELVRMSTADMLADLGYEVAEANSAEEALSLLRTGLKPDVVVTDHLMPGMSGAQLARELKKERPRLPVLIVSGYAEAEGVDIDVARLTKPFRNSELAASLADLMPPAAEAAHLQEGCR
ncbi:PAS domain S-box protein [Sphingomonas sp. NFR15]|uniref:PAS domain S-box protein n=1 Tax=Sphingomonas sp. NFR15 TaxID=1566282 RepID=UPI00210BD02C|nr:PAS domain S-box protein [Sphingomonas sp. NFR15]